jgi:hypothetical protein
VLTNPLSLLSLSSAVVPDQKFNRLVGHDHVQEANASSLYAYDVVVSGT